MDNPSKIKGSENTKESPKNLCPEFKSNKNRSLPAQKEAKLKREPESYPAPDPHIHSALNTEGRLFPEAVSDEDPVFIPFISEVKGENTLSIPLPDSILYLEESPFPANTLCNPDGEDFLKSIPAEDRAKVHKMLNRKDRFSEKNIPIYREYLKKYPDAAEIRSILLHTLYINDHLDAAEDLAHSFLPRYYKDPINATVLGLINLSRGKFTTALWYFKLANTPDNPYPYFRWGYGRTLYALNRKEEAAYVFQAEINAYRKTGNVYSPARLMECFSGAIEGDRLYHKGKTTDDLLTFQKYLCDPANKRFIAFKETLSAQIVEFSTWLEEKWFRPLFLNFVTFVDEKGFLAEEPFSESVRSAYTSLESWYYNDDSRISGITAVLLQLHNAVPPDNPPSDEQRKYPSEELDEYRQKLCYQCYFCLYYDELKDEIPIIRDQYPRTYAEVKSFFDEVSSKDPLELERQYEAELIELVPPQDSDDLSASIRSHAKKAFENRKKQNAISDGTSTYRRESPKVGLNDPCPCGSGKKYKKCCGRP